MWNVYIPGGNVIAELKSSLSKQSSPAGYCGCDHCRWKIPGSSKEIFKMFTR